jgi:hypothetical protein
MDSSSEVLPSSQSSSTSARPTTRFVGACSRKRGERIDHGRKNMNTCCQLVSLPCPPADDFTPDDTVLSHNPSTPNPPHIFLIFPLFLLSLTLAFLQQEVYSRGRVFLPTRPSSSFDIRSNKLLTFGNPCFRYSSAPTLVSRESLERTNNEFTPR